MALGGVAARHLEHRLARLLQHLVDVASDSPAAAALEYVRWYVPAKFRLLFIDGDGDTDLYRVKNRDWRRRVDLFSKEPELLERLRRATSASRDAGTPPKHTYCLRSWMAAIVADCVGHLATSILPTTWQAGHLDAQIDLLPLEPDIAGCRGAIRNSPAAQSGIDSWRSSGWRWTFRNLSRGQERPNEMTELFHGMETSMCLPEDVHWTLACGLSRFLEAQGKAKGDDDRSSVVQDLTFAAALAEDAALRLLLCDGCRYDGYGMNAIALDEILWTLGFLRYAATIREAWTKSGLNVAYSDAVAQFHAHPVSWWRGQGYQQILYGRNPSCPTAQRNFCGKQGGLFAVADQPMGAFVLPSCQLDHEPTDFSVVRDMSAESASSCAWAPVERTGLFIPVNVGALNSYDHLTGFLTWFLPAIAWLHGGPKVQELLDALWRRDGLEGVAPMELDVNNTEVFFVAYRGDEYFPPGVKTVSRLLSPWRDFFALFSNHTVLNLDEVDTCVCFQAAIWGYGDSSLRMHGDTDWQLSARLRGVMRTHFLPDVDVGSLHGRSLLLHMMAHRGFHVLPSAAATVSIRGVKRVGVLLAHRKTEKRGPLTRNITNRQVLSRSLASLLSKSPPLLLMEGSLEQLPLAVQVRLAVDVAEVMIQAFGAGMSWSTLLAPGSYVIEVQGDGVATTNFVSCFPPRNVVDGILQAGADPWEPPTNPHSEWGAWAFMNQVHFACVSKRPTDAHCNRQYFPTAWDTPKIEADVDLITELVHDAATRLRRPR